MKKMIVLILSLILTVPAICKGDEKSANDPVGKWKFDAPYAPEGFTTGSFEVKLAEQKLAATISFTGSEYILPCDKVKFENDILTFVLFLESEEIAFSLKFDETHKMSGKAVYSGGEVPLTLTREVKKD